MYGSNSLATFLYRVFVFAKCEQNLECGKEEYSNHVHPHSAHHDMHSFRSSGTQSSVFSSSLVSSSSFSSFSSSPSSFSSSASSSSSGTSTSFKGASGSTPSSFDINLYTRLTSADGSAISYPDSMSAVWKSTAAVSNAALSSLSALTLVRRSATTGWFGLISSVFRPDIIES